MSAAPTRTTATSGISRWLQLQWWQAKPTPFVQALRPLAALYLSLARWNRRRRTPTTPRKALLPVPVVVVGNLIVGGAGKTPATMALVGHLVERGWHPGIVSRGYGRQGNALVVVSAETPATACGDEPLLMHWRTHAPVAVAPNRLAAARALLAAHPEVDIVVADDGLQHWPLPRDVEVLVFDGRGAGNGLPLPAGPLREPMPEHTTARQLVLYNAAQPSTPLPGSVAIRALGGAVPLADWWAGQTGSLGQLQALAEGSQTQPLLAAAGMAAPEKYFSMLEAAGCRIVRQPLPDHASFSPLPWPDGTPDVLVTEKDAVKLRPGGMGNTRVWVVTLDFRLPPDFTAALDRMLPNPGSATP